MSNFEDIKPEPVQSATGVSNKQLDDRKRLRRDRSYAGRAHTGSVGKKTKPENKHDSAVRSIVMPQGVPLFLQKTYQMISNCGEDLAGWSNDGEMFVVKDTTKFAEEVIPRYFDHKKFPSFARQLNFYGFRKIQDRPIRNADIDKSTAKHVKFCNGNFKRDQPELLRNIQRSTRGGNAVNAQEQQRQINQLKEQVAAYEGIVVQLTARIDSMETKFSHLTEQLSQNQCDPDSKQGSGIGDISRRLSTVSLKPPSLPSDGTPPVECDPIPIADMSGSNISLASKSSTPTLPPHPKIKSDLPPSFAPNEFSLQKSRFNSRELSSTSLLRWTSNDSNVLDNSFDARLFTTIMLDEKEASKNERTISSVNVDDLLQRLKAEELDDELNNVEQL